MFSAEGLECGCDDVSPDTGSELTALKNALVAKPDVMDEASIATAVAAAEERFGRIDRTQGTEVGMAAETVMPQRPTIVISCGT